MTVVDLEKELSHVYQKNQKIRIFVEIVLWIRIKNQKITLNLQIFCVRTAPERVIRSGIHARCDPIRDCVRDHVIPYQ